VKVELRKHTKDYQNLKKRTRKVSARDLREWRIDDDLSFTLKREILKLRVKKQ
jgi:hypothetical protein